MLINTTYLFTASVWQHPSTGGWYFVSLPNELSQEIREHFGWKEEGWGRLKGKAKVFKSFWDTAIWYDTKLNTYILPLKAVIRKKEKIEIGNILDVEIII